MIRAAIVIALLVGLLPMGVIAIVAQASESQWAVSVKLEGPAGELSDPTTYFGVRPGATDGYDPGMDAPNPATPPGTADYVDLYFHRPSWPPQDDWAQDWRSVLAADASKSWGDIRAASTLAGECTLSWTLGADLAEWEPPAHYSFWLFDEGDAPDLGPFERQ